MDITIARNGLKDFLDLFTTIVKGKSPNRAFDCIKLDATDTLTGYATNGKASIHGTVQASVKKRGTVLLPLKELIAAVQAFPVGDVRLKLEEYRVKVSSGDRKFQLSTFPLDEFPQIPTIPEASIVLGSEALLRAIKHTSYAMLGDEGRPHLSSTLVEVKPGLLRLVTTDGHRLAKFDTALDGITGSRTFLVASEFIPAVKALAEDAYDKMLAFAFDKDHIYVSNANVSLSLPVVAATFPPYEQVIPQKHELTVTVTRERLLDSVKSVGIVAKKKLTNGIVLSITPKSITVSSEDESASATDKVECVSDSDTKLMIGFNADIVAQALASVDCEEVVLKCGGQLDPMVVRPVEYKDDALAVLMPMRV